MNEKPLREHIRQHYQAQRLPAQTQERLAAMVLRASAAPGGRWGRSYASWIGVAAAVVLLALNVYLGQRLRSAEALAHALRVQLERGDGTVDGNQALPGPRFVAVRTFATQCPMCRGTQAVFDALRSEFADRPVAFVALDASTEKTCAADERLAQCLGVDWATGICRECCAIRLLDRKEQKVLAMQGAIGDEGALRSALVAALDQPAP